MDDALSRMQHLRVPVFFRTHLTDAHQMISDRQLLLKLFPVHIELQNVHPGLKRTDVPAHEPSTSNDDRAEGHFHV
ncbi:MAG: hypothetical protein ACK56I_06400, partial [bacterium]